MPALVSGMVAEASIALPVLEHRIEHLDDAALRRLFEQMTGDSAADDEAMDAVAGEPWRAHVRDELRGALTLLYSSDEVVVARVGDATHAFTGGPEVADDAPTGAYDGIGLLRDSGITAAPIDQDGIDRLVALAEELGLDPEDLDGDVHDAKGNEAAAIDNGGFDSQVAYLAAATSLAWVESRLRGLAN